MIRPFIDKHTKLHLSSNGSLTYIKTRMYRDSITWFMSPLYIMWCGRLVYRLEKLTLARINLKIRKSFMYNVFKQY